LILTTGRGACGENKSLNSNQENMPREVNVFMWTQTVQMCQVCGGVYTIHRMLQPHRRPRGIFDPLDERFVALLKAESTDEGKLQSIYYSPFN